MNKVLLTGRLTKDPELRYTPSGTPVCRFNLAVSRPSAEGDADFVPCTAWGKTAENLAQYMRKGGLLAVEGRIQVSTYEKDGKRRWDIHVVAGRIEFMGNKRQDDAPEEAAPGGDSAPVNDYTQRQNDFTSPGAQRSFGDFGTEVNFSDEDLPF